MYYSFEYIMPGNRVILNTLYKSKDVEIFGSGFGKVYALFDKFSIRIEAAFKNDGFAFMFYRDTHQAHVTQNVTISVTDHDKEVKISAAARVYILLKEDPTRDKKVPCGKDRANGSDNSASITQTVRRRKNKKDWIQQNRLLGNILKLRSTFSAMHIFYSIPVRRGHHPYAA